MVLGAEHLPDPLAAKARPLLFVGNHTRFGLYDLPFLVCELYLRGFKVRRPVARGFACPNQCVRPSVGPEQVAPG